MDRLGLALALIARALIALPDLLEALRSTVRQLLTSSEANMESKLVFDLCFLGSSGILVKTGMRVFDVKSVRAAEISIRARAWGLVGKANWLLAVRSSSLKNLSPNTLRMINLLADARHEFSLEDDQMLLCVPFFVKGPKGAWAVQSPLVSSWSTTAPQVK